MDEGTVRQGGGTPPLQGDPNGRRLDVGRGPGTGVLAAAAGQPADGADGHVVVAKNLTAQANPGQPAGGQHRSSRLRSSCPARRRRTPRGRWCSGRCRRRRAADRPWPRPPAPAPGACLAAHRTSRRFPRSVSAWQTLPSALIVGSGRTESEKHAGPDRKERLSRQAPPLARRTAAAYFCIPDLPRPRRSFSFSLVGRIHDGGTGRRKRSSE